MIQASQTFIDIVNGDNRMWRARLLHNGTDTGASIKALSVMGGSMSETTFSLCGCYSSSMTAIIDSIDFVWENKEIEVQFGLVTDDTTDPVAIEWLSVGKYTITEPEVAKYQTTLIGAGNLSSKCGVDFTTPTTQSIANIISAVETQAGVTINVESGIDTSLVIDKEILNMSCFGALQIVASVLGCFVTDKADGTILIAKYPQVSTYAVSTNRMTQEPTFADIDNEITGVRVIVQEQSLDGDGQPVPEVEYHTENVNYTVANAYMTETAFTEYADNLVGITWRKSTVPIAMGDPRLEATDLMTVTVDEVEYSVPVHNFVHNFDGGLQTTVYALGESESLESSQQTGFVTRQLKEIEADILRVENIVAQSIDIGGHFFVGSDGYVHITETENDYNTGNNILIDSDSVDIRDGTTTRASFGAITQIGNLDIDCGVLQIKPTVICAIDETTNEYFSLKDLRVDGKYTETWQWDGGQTYKFNVQPDRDDTGENATVTINGVEQEYPTDYYFFYNDLEYSMFVWLREPLSTNDTITATYVPASWNVIELKSFTLGSRSVGAREGLTSFASGYLVGASGDYSHAEGYMTHAEGLCSHAEGRMTYAMGNYSHAEGEFSIAKGTWSHAEGDTTQAIAPFSHAEGSNTQAKGYVSHAEGAHTEANGYYSHAGGYYTIADDNAQTVIGMFNVPDSNSAFIIGNGSRGDYRSNAFKVDWNGNVTMAGYFTTLRVDKGGGTTGKLWTKDKIDFEYPLIGDNGTNLMIGARETQTQHHTGFTIISAGYNNLTSEGNATILVSVPNATNTGATNHSVWHSGNLPISKGSNITDIAIGDTVTTRVLMGGTSTNKVFLGAHNNTDNKRYDIRAQAGSFGLLNVTDSSWLWQLSGLSGIINVGTLNTTVSTLNTKVNNIGTVVNSNPDAKSIASGDTAQSWANFGNIKLTAGTWIIHYIVRWNQRSGGFRSIGISTTSAGSPLSIMANDVQQAVDGTYTLSRVTVVLSPTATTTYYLNGMQNSGSALTGTPRCVAVRIK